jgi:predicted NBD/HSP70 family sugar kinase
MTKAARAGLTASHGEIFNLIRLTPNISRSEIARETALALSTASSRVDSLIQNGLVVEVGQLESRGGRRAIGLTVNGAAGRFGIILVAPGSQQVRVVDFSGAVLASHPLPNLSLGNPEIAMKELFSELVTLVASVPGTDEIACVCVAVDSLVEYPTGTLMTPAPLPGWHGFSVRASLAQLTDVPVLVEKLANLEAIAERLEVPHRTPDLMAVVLGDHIGCGIVIKGELYRGAFGAAGEIGHSSVLAESVVPCTCSAPSCLDSTASARAIAVLMRRAGLSVDSVADVVEIGNSNSIEGSEIVRTAGRLIGGTIANAINLINPDQLVISGPLSECVPLIRAVRSVVLEQALSLNTSQMHIRVSGLGADSALRGAAVSALDFLLSVERIDGILADS